MKRPPMQDWSTCIPMVPNAQQDQDTSSRLMLIPLWKTPTWYSVVLAQKIHNYRTQCQCFAGQEFLMQQGVPQLIARLVSYIMQVFSHACIMEGHKTMIPTLLHQLTSVSNRDPFFGTQKTLPASQFSEGYNCQLISDIFYPNEKVDGVGSRPVVTRLLKRVCNMWE